MSNNYFYPFMGTDTVNFGNTRDEVRNQLQEFTFRNFLRNEFAENTTDHYSELGFFVEYDSQDICVAIEFSNQCNLYFEGGNLFEYSFNELVEKYSHQSMDKFEEAGLYVTFKDLGFGACKEAELNKIESIIIFSKNYWD